MGQRGALGEEALGRGRQAVVALQVRHVVVLAVRRAGRGKVRDVVAVHLERELSLFKILPNRLIIVRVVIN